MHHLCIPELDPNGPSLFSQHSVRSKRGGISHVPEGCSVVVVDFVGGSVDWVVLVVGFVVEELVD